MELVFDLTKEDYINFNIDHLHISEVTKKRIFFQRYIFSLIFLVVPFIIVKVTDMNFWYWMIVFVIAYIYNVVFYNKRLEKRIIKHVNKLLKETNSKALIGKKILKVSKKGIEQISDVETSNTKWSAIEKMVEYPEYIYIYNTAISAYIIPTRIFGNHSEQLEFLKLVRSYINK